MPREIPLYEDVRLELSGAGDEYVVRLSTGSETAEGRFTLPFAPHEVEVFRLKVDPGRGRVRGGRDPKLGLAKDFGGRLFDALMDDAGVRAAYSHAQGRAHATQRGLRLTLALSDAPALTGLPWEFLYRRPDFLAQSIWTPVVRYLTLERSTPVLRISSPLRILGMVSRPVDDELADLDAEEEQSRLEDALRPLVDGGLVELRWLPSATLRDLQREVAHGPDFHVFHYIGHGRADDAGGESSLVLERRDRRAVDVGGEELGRILCDRRTVRLAVLNACEAAATSPTDPLAGVAASLVERDVPAVVGMQFSITDDAAILFSEEFYAALADGYPVDAAVTEARRALATEDPVQWATPVLFMRVSDGRLFEISGERAPAPAPAPPPERPPETPPPKPRPPREATPFARLAHEHVHASRIMALATGPDGALAVGRASGEIERWSVGDEIARTRVSGGGSGVKGLAFAGDAIAALVRNRVVLPDAPAVFDVGKAVDIAASPARPRFVVATGSGGVAHVWDARSGAKLATLKPGGMFPALHAVAWSPDGRVIAGGADNRTVWLWHGETYERFQRLKGGWLSSFTALAFSADGRTIVGVADGSTAQVWRVRGGEGVFTTPSEIGVDCAALSPDGKLLATGGAQGMQLWEVGKGRRLPRQEPPGRVTAVAFDPGGGYLAAGADDGALRIWR